VSDAFGGSLNILVNNVGTNIRKPTADFTDEVRCRSACLWRAWLVAAWLASASVCSAPTEHVHTPNMWADVASHALMCLLCTAKLHAANPAAGGGLRCCRRGWCTCQRGKGPLQCIYSVLVNFGGLCLGLLAGLQQCAYHKLGKWLQAVSALQTPAQSCRQQQHPVQQLSGRGATGHVQRHPICDEQGSTEPADQEPCSGMGTRWYTCQLGCTLVHSYTSSHAGGSSVDTSNVLRVKVGLSAADCDRYEHAPKLSLQFSEEVVSISSTVS
jgi:hypothetical protein